MCSVMYRRRIEMGRYFVHEQLHGAGSWQEPEVKGLIKLDGVPWVRMDQCETGQGLDMPDGSRVLARKTTDGARTPSTSPMSCQTFSEGIGAAQSHASSGKAKFTAAYAMMLVTAELRGLREQMEQDGEMLVNSLEPGATGHDETEYPDEDVAKFYVANFCRPLGSGRREKKSW
eukprot:5176555-Amphidinium_carterae.1